MEEVELSEISRSSTMIDSLSENNDFAVQIFNYLPDSPSGKALGGFGRIMKPTYFIAPHISDGTNSLVDLGYRTQQIVMGMWNKGTGSCYVGCAHRQLRVKQLLDIPEENRIISFVIFGKPDTNQSLRIYQKISQFFTKSKKRLSFEELFIDGKLPRVMKQDMVFRKILEAGRQAPSATNSQPWRFELKSDNFVIYAHHKKVANIYDLQQGYSFHDTGICMANMSMAAKALGKNVRWRMVNTDDKIHSIIEANIPIAYFLLNDLRNQT